MTLDHDTIDIREPVPAWRRFGDLDQFASLGEADRMRVIIRVLCGLVALESDELLATTEAPSMPKRPLPVLGPEVDAQRKPAVTAAPAAASAPPTSTPGERRRTLPYLGLQRPF